jgi:hypothetical protein
MTRAEYLRSQAIDEAPADPAEEVGPKLSRGERLIKFLRDSAPGDEEQRAAWGRSIARSPATLAGSFADTANAGLGALQSLGRGESPLEGAGRGITPKPVLGSQWLAEHIPFMPEEPGSPYADAVVGLASPLAGAAGRTVGAVEDAIASAKPGPVAGGAAAQRGAIGVPKGPPRAAAPAGEVPVAPEPAAAPVEAPAAAKVGAAGARESSAAVAARRKMMREVLSQPVEDWKPPAQNLQLFDRSLIRDAMEGHPGVEQKPLERMPPTKRTQLGHIENIFTPENTDLIRMQVERGDRLGGRTYYPSTYAIRARYGELNTPVTFEDFMRANELTSPQSSLPVNIPTASVLTYMKAQGIPITPENFKALSAEIAAKYGTSKYFATPERVSQFGDFMAGKAPEGYGYSKSQKISGYGEDLRGNFEPQPLDTHELGGLSMGTAYHKYIDSLGSLDPVQYGPFEQRYRQFSREQMGRAPANTQAARWFGGGDLTGLKSPPGDFLATLEDSIRFSAQKRGMDLRTKALREYGDRVLAGQDVLVPHYGKGRMPIDYSQFGP